MKKIMFNDTYGLTSAVLQGRKTMTRRIITDEMAIQSLNEQEFMQQLCLDERFVKKYSRYKVGEVVAVAQPYKDFYGDFKEPLRTELVDSAGFFNKMFVKSELMPHRIRITDLKVERLQDISVRDCMREGIIKKPDPFIGKDEMVYYFEGSDIIYVYPTTAFAALIDKVSGRGTWENNPWVYAYSFELVK